MESPKTMKSRVLLFLSFALGTGAICAVSGYFLDRKVLAWSMDQVRTGMAPLTEAYKSAEGSRSRRAPTLESLNDGFLKNPGPALSATPPKFILNLGPDGSRRSLQLDKDQARPLALGYQRIREDLMLRGQAYDRGSRTIYLKEEVPYIRLGVFHTIVGVSAAPFEKKRLSLMFGLGALWLLANLAMAVVFFGPGQSRGSPRIIREPERPGRFTTTAGARPMEGINPFQPRTSRPVGERFFKEEYLSENKPATPSPEATAEPIPARLRTFQEVMGPGENRP